MLACDTCLGRLESKDRMVIGEISNLYTIPGNALAAGRIADL